MEPNNKKSSVLTMEMEPVTVTDPQFWKWEDQILDATLGTSPKISIVTRRSGKSHIDQYFLENLTRAMCSRIGAMLQAQQSQQQPTATPIEQLGSRGFYSDWELAALMGYTQVYTEASIPIIWKQFQMSKECADNRQEILSGMMYWSKKNGIEIDTDVFFVKLSIKEMVKIKFNMGGPVAMYESAESDISPLMVIPITTQEIEEEIRREEAAAKSQETRTQVEVLQNKKEDPRRPPRNWY